MSEVLENLQGSVYASSVLKIVLTIEGARRLSMWSKILRLVYWPVEQRLQLARHCEDGDGFQIEHECCVQPGYYLK